MNNPYVEQRVRVDGKQGTYVVLWVDGTEGIVDIAPTTDTYLITRSIPFKMIHPIEGDR